MMESAAEKKMAPSLLFKRRISLELPLLKIMVLHLFVLLLLDPQDILHVQVVLVPLKNVHTAHVLIIHR